MYAVPIIALALVIAVGVVWAPIFAFIIAVPLFVLFLAYVGMSRRADEKATKPVAGQPSAEEGKPPHGGIWGERERNA